ncbi:PAS domain S-box protein [Methanosarcina sp. MSH10X1]|nr:PAS domain S-box protein [Methanosarcina sp. MSH10X1]
MGHDLKDLESTDMGVWLDHIHPEERNKIWKTFEKYLETGENFRLEYRFRKHNENYIHIEENVICLKDENGSVNRVLGIIKDITERKLTQERLEDSEEKYRSFIQNFDGIAFQLDENFFPEFMHGKVEEITGYSEEKFLSGQFLWIDIIHSADKPLVIEDINNIQKSPYNSSRELDFRIIHSNGRTKWVHQCYYKIQGKDGKPEKYQGVIYDITEKKNTEEALEKIEAIRNKEIHHRIKNNLQVISSLLDLQAEKFNDRECIKNSEVLTAFRESQDRVMSIALIHEELHEGEGRDTLNFSPYLEKLVENLFQTYRLGDKEISLIMNLEEDIFFDMDTAVPLGMIVNELVSNSLKYAFPDRKTGEIRINLFREGKAGNSSGTDEKDGEKELTEKCTGYTLIISDNGIGIPEKIDFENPDTLGLQLVTILVEQLDSEIELKRNKGTRFKIRFNVKQD